MPGRFYWNWSDAKRRRGALDKTGFCQRERIWFSHSSLCAATSEEAKTFIDQKESDLSELIMRTKAAFNRFKRAKLKFTTTAVPCETCYMNTLSSRYGITMADSSLRNKFDGASGINTASVTRSFCETDEQNCKGLLQFGMNVFLSSVLFDLTSSWAVMFICTVFVFR